MKNKEVWVPVNETNNLYKISNLGRIISSRSGLEIRTNNQNQVSFHINNEVTLHTKIELMSQHFKVDNFSIQTLNKQTPQAIYGIVEKVMRYYNLSESTLFSETRNRYVVTARQMIFKLSKQTTNYSLSKIGRFLNTKDHQMPAYSVKNISQLIEVNRDIKNDYDQLLNSIITATNNALCRAIEKLIPL